MAGGPNVVASSLQRKLSIWVSAVIIGLTVIAGFVSYLSAFNEANEFQDDVLQQVAASFERDRVELRPSGAMTCRGRTPEGMNAFFVQPLRPSAGSVQESTPRFGLSDASPDGLRTIAAGGCSWRVLVHTAVSGERLIVAQQTDLRDDIARNSGLTSIIPLLVLIPLLLLILTFVIRKMFEPVNRLAREMEDKTHAALAPISMMNVPRELLPFVGATNALLSRVSEAVTQQRRFIADAAHELRSPLTALSLHIQRLEASNTAALLPQDDLQTLKSGVQRLSDLIAQLLSLARVQGSEVRECVAFPVVDVVYQILEDLASQAQAKTIDLGLLKSETIYLLGDRFEFFTAVRNLVDNAIRYSGVGSQVDIAVYSRAGRAYVQVADEGPGIAESDRLRVFDPFYRILGTQQQGSGLGLSIVRNIVEKMDGSITLSYTDETSKRGLSVTLSFPMDETAVLQAQAQRERGQRQRQDG